MPETWRRRLESLDLALLGYQDCLYLRQSRNCDQEIIDLIYMPNFTYRKFSGTVKAESEAYHQQKVSPFSRSKFLPTSYQAMLMKNISWSPLGFSLLWRRVGISLEVLKCHQLYYFCPCPHVVDERKLREVRQVSPDCQQCHLHHYWSRALDKVMYYNFGTLEDLMTIVCHYCHTGNLDTPCGKL